MRLIGILSSEEATKKFSIYLKKMKVPHSIDVQTDSIHKGFSYGVWIHNEDDLEKVTQAFEEFQLNPEDPKFTSPPEKIISIEEEKNEKLFPRALTYFFIIFCCLIFGINWIEEIEISKNKQIESPIITPLYKAFLFDAPDALDYMEKKVEEYHIDLSKPIEEQTSEIQRTLLSFNELPFWKGAYTQILETWHPSKIPSESGPLFEDIKHGQVYRIISPIFLHGNLIHILFNMLWVALLGFQIEKRMSRFNFLLLVLIVAAVSNTVQYIVSGPLFLGFSGVIMGMAAYIGVREKIAPWEGFTLSFSTILFLVFYVIILLILSLSSFLLQGTLGYESFPLNIANTAHIVGGLTGVLLARFPLLIGKRT